jgi:membrane protein implicated in regulation of membrane protease activity
LGTFGALVLVRWFGAALAEPIDLVLVFVRDNVRWLTIASVAIVIVSALVRRRRARKLGGPVERGVDASEV